MLSCHGPYCRASFPGADLWNPAIWVDYELHRFAFFSSAQAFVGRYSFAAAAALRLEPLPQMAASIAVPIVVIAL